MHIFDISVGRDLVRAARSAIELCIKNPEFDRKIVLGTLDKAPMHQKFGVFVTLTHGPTGTLRGCIGFPDPVMPVGMSVVEAALAAAFEDPRFVSVSHKELDELIIEVSILSGQTLLHKDWRKRKNSIVVGRDGLVVEYGVHKGLLLPDVPIEQGWDTEEFFEGVMEKAEIHKGYWKQPNVKLYKFETQIFREEEPDGDIIEVDLLKKGP